MFTLRLFLCAPLLQATSLPLTTFAQNNGVISLTAVASRQAGWACAIWLFLLGVIAKFAAVITTIPDCVFGGMTTFLFANVIASGIKIIVGECSQGCSVLTRNERSKHGLLVGFLGTLHAERIWDSRGQASFSI